MDVTRWRRDPVAFLADVLRDPETGEAFVLSAAQEAFVRLAFTPTPDGRLPYPELLFACPKKGGKSTLAGMAMLYVIVVLGGRYAEGYCVANDLEQAQGRVFEGCRRMVEASPLLGKSTRVTGTRIEFPATGATITALASDYAESQAVRAVLHHRWAGRLELAKVGEARAVSHRRLPR